MRLAVVLAKLCATESPTIFATGRKDSGNRLIGIPYRLAMIVQWARLFTQLTTFRTMTCFGESNGSAVQHERSKRSPNGCLHGTAARRRNESAECEIALLSNKENRKNRRGPIALHLDCFSMATACVNEPRC